MKKPPKRQNPTSTTRHFCGSQQGSVLVPILILATIMAVVFAGVGSMVFSTLKSRLARASKGALNDIIINFEECIIDGPSWALSLADSSLAADTTADVKKKLRLLEAPIPGGGKNLCGTKRNPTTMAVEGLEYDSNIATAGFTVDGQVCNTYSDAGSDGCPYHFDFYRVLSCNGPATCSEPTETVLITIKFHAGPKATVSALNLGDNFVRPGKDQTIAVTRSSANRRNAMNWTAVPLYPTGGKIASMTTAILALAGQVQALGSRLPVVLIELETTGKGGGDAGACNSAVGIARNLNLVQSDPGLVGSANSGVITLTAGVYECSISVPGFMVGHFHAIMQQTSAPKGIVVQGSDEYSPRYGSLGQARSTGSGRFVVSATSTFEVRQFCTDAPVDPSPNPNMFNIKNLGLGFPSGMPPDVYSIVNCQTYYRGL